MSQYRMYTIKSTSPYIRNVPPACHQFKKFGIHIEEPKLDLKKMMQFKNQCVRANVRGVEFLFKKMKSASSKEKRKSRIKIPSIFIHGKNKHAQSTQKISLSQPDPKAQQFQIYMLMRKISYPQPVPSNLIMFPNILSLWEPALSDWNWDRSGKGLEHK